MAYLDEYENQNSEDSQYYLIEQRSGQQAINDLMKADQEEVYRFEACYDGIFNYCSEDKTKLIGIGFSGTNFTMKTYMTIPEFLIHREINYIAIQLYEID